MPRRTAVLLVLAGGLLAVVAGGRTWVRVVPDGAVGLGPVAVTGREVTPAGVALGLVALAGAVVLVTSGRVVRAVVAVLLLAAGAGVVAAGLLLGVDVGQVARGALAAATGATGAVTEFRTARTAWPPLAAAGGGLVVLGALGTLLGSRRWDGPSRRFEPAGPAAATSAGSAAPVASAASQRDRAFDAWDALSAGTDPTAGDPDGDPDGDPYGDPRHR